MNKLLFTITVALILISCRTDDGTDSVKLEETAQYKTLNNVDDKLLSLDIYYTDDLTTQKPVVIWVHGGGWSIGDKKTGIEDKKNLFQAQNWLFVSVNYRLSPLPYQLSNPDRVKYPDHNNDLADALKWIYEHIEEFGGDPNKLLLLGHSAGAHLVSLTGTNKDLLEQRNVPFSVLRGVASIDTEGYDVLGQVLDGNKLYINAFGDDPAQNIEAGPINHIHATTSYPKFFIAKRGDAQRMAIANSFIADLESVSVSVTQIDGSVYSHTEINEAIGKKNETLITDPLVAFFYSCVQ